MTDFVQRAEQIRETSRKISALLARRIDGANGRFRQRVHDTTTREAPDWTTLAEGWAEYMTDVMQRSVLFWDTLHQRGNQFVAHQKAGLPPVLGFEYETVLDARTFGRPVNYALLRIVPPAGVTVYPERRPYVIIDPRAGHGPGIGGFKDDSQVGVALRAGHPVYFVTFFHEPEPGQTLLDVTEAEAAFVSKVRELHPQSGKPVIVGNCQGGWAAMMVAATHPEEAGPVVINGAPMSYWGGAWEDGDHDNPMRYAGGLLGGTWMSSMISDLSDGIFDGAWLVQNFENLNPANSYWKKYYHLFANIDTEPARFLEFERWWGGFYLMNREEIEWITQTLFIGNTLWDGGVKAQSGRPMDLRDIRSPIVLFASMGDNITPPEQAFNWVADIYGSTEEIKARGQVIVGLLHADVGHLGIFVSGAVARKEHAQIVSVMKSIEALPPGLYGMNILTIRSDGGEERYEVEFIEQRLEDVSRRLNRYARQDEKPFETVAAISGFNQRAYELFARPLVQGMANEATAKLARDFHPLRFQRWAISDINPWLGWLAPAAQAVRAQRTPLGGDHPWRVIEAAASDIFSASLDFQRDIGNALKECLFFHTYGNLFTLTATNAGSNTPEAAIEPRNLPMVKAALGKLSDGGYTEAAARLGFLLHRHGAPMPLSRLELRVDLAKDLAHLMPSGAPDELRRIRGEQEIIVCFEPDKAISSLPTLLQRDEDRVRMLALLAALTDEPRVRAMQLTQDQEQMIRRIREAIAPTPSERKITVPLSKRKSGRSS
ncbi:alpha/beta hydrolase family protein [Methyloversatilis sp. RAC08]|uniref:alpha/beta fold hydrolase n=1 Tax=Methyloversatilis sp. RAC08 TaxID=1842540 RepID=UPI00083CB10F|nr:alpha/beta fold hydrolase [Methyloversatilis sp. RAC08]AOF83043.1 alpha/beta hydrolase family protein [Methyloversatilis sp. RAC08]